ncbi:ROK family protein [Aestuariivirga sp.]|uniref:ROK family protein n=1 Tax=Aestuariivirga sp. TaxID=2650926 RepID=UPI0039E51849
MTQRIGIDLGGTKIDCALLSEAGEVQHSMRVETPQGYDAIVREIAAQAWAAQQVAGGKASIGIGSPGSQSPLTGLWRNSNIVACNGKPFAADLAAAIGQPVKLENDANCFALSEALDGAGKGSGTVAFFTVGTALGGGLVINGRLHVGANAEAAEFGHTGLPWPTDGEWPPLPCFCGKRGCAEQYVSGTGLARDYKVATGHALPGKEIVKRARFGETEAKAALARLQDRLARVAANLVAVIDPDVFVIGGGLSTLPELVEELPPLIAHYSFSGSAQVKVLRAAHGETSGVLGAARLWD